MFKSQRGADKLFVEGYSFERSQVKRNTESSKEYWRCERFRSCSGCCPVRLDTTVTLDGSRQITRIFGGHNHEGKPERAKVADRVTALKEIAVLNTGIVCFFLLFEIILNQDLIQDPSHHVSSQI